MDYKEAESILIKKHPDLRVFSVTFYKDLYVFGVADKDAKPDKRTGYWISTYSVNKNSGAVESFDSSFMTRGDKRFDTEEYNTAETITFLDQNPFHEIFEKLRKIAIKEYEDRDFLKAALNSFETIEQGNQLLQYLNDHPNVTKQEMLKYAKSL